MLDGMDTRPNRDTGDLPRHRVDGDSGPDGPRRRNSLGELTFVEVGRRPEPATGPVPDELHPTQAPAGLLLDHPPNVARIDAAAKLREVALRHRDDRTGCFDVRSIGGVDPTHRLDGGRVPPAFVQKKHHTRGEGVSGSLDRALDVPRVGDPFS